MKVVIDGVEYVPTPAIPTDKGLIGALDLRTSISDTDDTTVRGYLHALLEALWTEGEGFSGKRPLGESDWQWQLYEPLVRAGLVKGTFDDEEGEVEVDDERAAYDYVLELIAAAFFGVDESEGGK